MLKGQCQEQACFVPAARVGHNRGDTCQCSSSIHLCVCFWELLKCVSSIFVNQELLILVRMMGCLGYVTAL